MWIREGLIVLRLWMRNLCVFNLTHITFFLVLSIFVVVVLDLCSDNLRMVWFLWAHIILRRHRRRFFLNLLLYWLYSWRLFFLLRRKNWLLLLSDAFYHWRWWVWGAKDCKWLCSKCIFINHDRGTKEAVLNSYIKETQMGSLCKLVKPCKDCFCAIRFINELIAIQLEWLWSKMWAGSFDINVLIVWLRR